MKKIILITAMTVFLARLGSVIAGLRAVLKKQIIITATIIIAACTVEHRPPVVPSVEEVNASFGAADRKAFQSPPSVYHPETWFHLIGGNVDAKGITADLEAIAGAGLSGIQLFHGQFGGPWPGVEPQIACLSPMWETVLKHTAKECRRLGLRFTMQNCPGWSMSGGPWITPENAMRHLVLSRTDTEGAGTKTLTLPIPKPSSEEWRDYRDVAVLTFPTPRDDDGEPLKPSSVKSNIDLPWKDLLLGKHQKPLKLPPISGDSPRWVEIAFPNAVAVRTIEFSSIKGFNQKRSYDPGVTISAYAVLPDGEMRKILSADMPQSSGQDEYPISFACPEVDGVKTYRIEIVNRYNMSIGSLRLYSAARKNNWEAEAGWALRSIVRENDSPLQSPDAFIRRDQIRDLSAMTDRDGNLVWDAPSGKWTILRIGHVNTGMKNGPAPPEGVGWECNKLAESGPDAQFAGYIGKLSGNDGAVGNGLLNGMLLDSWECGTQTWTRDMEGEFEKISGYGLRGWLPAVFGYVVDSHETTGRFLRDWHGVIGDLFANRFYGRMARLAKDNGLNIIYETAAGDVFPADVLEYFKYADVPVCEFWHPYTDYFLGSLNFRPVKPTASAARLYGKPRVAAEAFTSFDLTWDEHLSMLKEVANHNYIEGVTHLIFHTYTHNPRTDVLPGAAFGDASIGTPFLRGQTWWKYMPEFTDYLARCNYLFERGKPVSDVLWYLGDEINHKPDQNAPFPDGYKYDYCNPDILLNRLSVRDGKIVTPEGISYRVMWLPDNRRMLPATLEKILAMVRDGAIIIGNAPASLATLSGGESAQRRFDEAVKALWGDASDTHIASSGENIRAVGNGKVLSGMTIDAAVKVLNIPPDVTGGKMWLHRRAEGADWYYVCAPTGGDFRGELSFNNSDNVEIWDPVSGEFLAADVTGREAGRTSIRFDPARAGSCFVVFGKTVKPADAKQNVKTVATATTLAGPWTIAFPDGWGAPASLEIKEPKAWNDLDMSSEARAFSGTATYSTTFDVGKVAKGAKYSLDLGRVEMIAAVTLNGKKLRALWTPPYRIDVTAALKSGKNTLKIDVTGTWFNRLVYDAGQPEDQRKTWTFNRPPKNSALRESGLSGPVVLIEK